MNQFFLNTTLQPMNAYNTYLNVGPNCVVRPQPSRQWSVSSSSLSSSPDSSAISPARNADYDMSGDEQNIPRWLTNNAMFDPIRYKTEMCKNFQELAECKFADKCYYAHYSHELKAATYKHKKYKTQLCIPFHKEGFCDFGARCAFIHSKPDVDKIMASLQTFMASAAPMPTANTLTKQMVAEEQLFRTEAKKWANEKRLKVFERFTSKPNQI